ncbi:MAG TPA: response regulator [Kofleriaceae bacterium]|nr:response regulator [Kofleriaceae bacterium]
MTQRRILLVDDNEALRLTTAALLEDAGYEVVEADSVATGRARLRDGSLYDAAVLDVHLGDGVGHDLFADLRELQPQAVIVLLSGTAIPEEMVGADLALTKGMPPDELLGAIARVLAARPR